MLPSKTLQIMAFLSAYAMAVPTDLQAEPHCDGMYLVEKWGHTVAQPTWNSTLFGTFKGCQAASPVRRGDPHDPSTYDTRVETQNDAWQTNWKTGTTAPQDFIWDRADEVCGDIHCDGSQSITVVGDADGRIDGQDLVLSLDGIFADRQMRDNFISLIRDANHKSVAVSDILPGYPKYGQHGTGTGYYAAVTEYGDASGYHMTARLHNEADAVHCPDVVSQIMSFGALVPELGPVFGFAGALCGALG